MTFYIVPTKLTDRIPEMMSSFSTTLYPLSSEAAVTNRLDDLLRIYHNMVRILFLTSGLLGTVIMVSSKGILMVWMGPEFMSRSWLVLVFLAAGAIWRSSGTVAYQVCNGLGRADINLYGSIGTAVLITVPVILLAPLFGTVGIALGLFLGLLVSNLLYDIYTQRKLLGCKSWKAILLPYGRIFIVEVITFVIINFIQLEVSIWITLPLKIVLTSLLFICMSYMMGALQVKDINFIIDKISILLKRLSRNKKDTIHMKA
jgi:O-antigen/teichoic acid export membrane protein